MNHPIAPEVLRTVGESSRIAGLKVKAGNLGRRTKCKVELPKVKVDNLGKRTKCIDSSSSLPGTISTAGQSSSDESERGQRNDKLSRAAGFAIMKQMNHFDSSTRLEDNGFRPFVELAWKDLKVESQLGSGGFSSVYCASIVPEERQDSQQRSPMIRDAMNHRKFAVKLLDKKVWNKDLNYVCQAAADLALEAKMLSRLNHENIIQLYGTSAVISFMDQRGYFLVLGLLSETLARRLQRWRASGHKRVAHRLRSAAIGIARGMEYLHKNNVVFRDLKPNNVGWCQESGKIQIFDFGLSVELHKGERLKSTVGTPRYMAPEVALGTGYDSSCDVHSFGIVLWQICSLQKGPFPGKKREEIWELVAIKGQRPPLDSVYCPERIKKLMEDCWDENPQVRPTFKVIRKRLEKVLRTM